MNNEIAKLAREYAEEYTRKNYPNAPGHVRERIIEGRLEHMEDFIPWLLRTHCIVSKEKVRKSHTAELDLALFYTRRANSCCNNTCRSAYEGSKDAALSRASLLESLFDAETFKNSEV